MKELMVPRFDSEADEARWDENSDTVEANIIEAMENGAAGRGGVQRLLEKAQRAAADNRRPRKRA